MNPLYFRIIFTTWAICFFNAAYSQDKILSKSGDTLRVYVKGMDTQMVSYTMDKDSKTGVKEISKQELHKIIWRSGKEYVLDAEFDKKVSVANPQSESTINKAITKEDIDKNPALSKEKATVLKAPVPTPVQESLPPAPHLARKYRFFYIAYKVDGKRVKPKEFIKVVEKYDTDSYQEISVGYETY